MQSEPQTQMAAGHRIAKCSMCFAEKTINSGVSYRRVRIRVFYKLLEIANTQDFAQVAPKNPGLYSCV